VVAGCPIAMPSTAAISGLVLWASEYRNVPTPAVGRARRVGIRRAVFEEILKIVAGGKDPRSARDHEAADRRIGLRGVDRLAHRALTSRRSARSSFPAARSVITRVASSSVNDQVPGHGAALRKRRGKRVCNR